MSKSYLLVLLSWHKSQFSSTDVLHVDLGSFLEDEITNLNRVKDPLTISRDLVDETLVVKL